MTKGLSIIIFAVLLAACQGKSGNVANNSTNTPASKMVANAATASPAEQRVVIDSPDRVKLVGTFYVATDQRSPGVLLLHQWQSDRHSYDDLARRLQAKGFAVLSIDGRGFGDSTNTADGKTVQAERTDAAVKAMLGDVGAAFDYLTKQKNVDAARVGIIGASYGSSLAIIYAADNPKVKAVGLLSPGTNYFGNMPTEPALKKYGDRPLLMVAANDDKESADAVNKLKAAVTSQNYEVKIYDKGGHGTGLFKAGVGLEDLLEQFLAVGLR
jgi:dienelactone hydrolase